MVAKDAHSFVFLTDPNYEPSLWKIDIGIQIIQFLLPPQDLSAWILFKGPNELPAPQQIDITQKLASLIEYLNVSRQ